jgi:hypothetical protein
MFMMNAEDKNDFLTPFIELAVRILWICAWSNEKYLIHITVPPISDAQNAFVLFNEKAKSYTSN